MSTVLSQALPLPSGQRGLPAGLRRGNFRCLADRGFGDPRNSYAHSMAWYRGQLYVGTTRNIFQLVNIAPDPSTDAFHLWPVPVPSGLDAASLDQRCQIWRCSPPHGAWEKSFESPRVPSVDGSAQVWRDFGYRSMVVEQTDSDQAPTLYVTTMSSSKAPGALILRSPDGESFEPVTEQGLGDRSVSSFRAFVGFDGRLFASPAGRGRLWAFTGAPLVLESRDPVSRAWRPVSEPGFGDATNGGIFEMAVFNNHVYAGVANAETGLQVWKTDARGVPPYRWTKVLSHGAGRGRLNQAVMSMFPFKGALYVGTGIRRGGYDRENKTGPAAGEVIRIDAEDRWELVVGEARRTPDGEREPLSGLGPGFDNPFNGYIWCMAEYGGNLYVGTYDSSLFLWWVDPARVPRGTHPGLRLLGPDRVVEREAGFDLWRSPDGVHWFEVSRDGFGNPYNYGVRTMLGRDGGLYVGTGNPFGPEVAVRTATGWGYAPNPRGGLEIWMGSPAFTPSADPPPGAAGAGPAPTVAGAQEPRRRPAGAVNQHYDHSMFEHPLLRSGEYMSYSRFSNYGCWDRTTANQKEACEALMERLLDFLPRRSGRILDVACGLGETSRYLARDFGAENVIGINISEKQIEACRATAPGSAFLLMDATQLDFEDESLDHVICVEAAFHFRTRARFLREAFRVLKPGGVLILSDMLFSKAATARSPVLHPDNYVAGPTAYRGVLERAGFEEVRVVDATRESFLLANERFIHHAIEKFVADEIDPKTFKGVLANRLGLLLCMRYYTLAGARKPGGVEAPPSGAAAGDAAAADRAARPHLRETSMESDTKIPPPDTGRLRRSALAHWILSSVAKRQGRLHRELATLLDKEAEALAALESWNAGEAKSPATPQDAGDAAPRDRATRQQTEAARQESLAHRDLALRSDARAL
ncbi:MAG TPA: class I SAM-dependent methyltransferase, partial [Candidatus Polarisedimenticolia bacterium]|nr:class I SAM-dependent methyltransferase [Candidatus Polarisedimenticolia bacterium]